MRDSNEETYISQLIQSYEEAFEDDWIEKLDWENKSNESLDEGIQKISDFSNSFFILFAKSIISGEYIYYGDKLIKLFSEFLELIKIEAPPNKEDKLFFKFRELRVNIEVILKHYHSFIDTINSKIIYDFSDDFVNAFSTPNGEDLSINLFVDLRDLFINIAFIDHNNIYEDDRIRSLILSYHTIEIRKKDKKINETIKKLYEKLSDKCLFLLNKLSFFKEREVEYCIDFVKQKINTGEVDNTDFKNYDINFSYFYRDKKIDNNSILLWQKNCQLGHNKIELWQFILLIRFYTKKANTLSQIQNLVDIFDKYYAKNIHKQKSEFDRYAFNTIKNFMHNCMFSYRIKFPEKSYKLEDLIEDLQKIITIQNETSIRNYYPYKKTLEYLLKSIRGDLKKGDKKEEIQIKKECFDNCLPLFKESFNWCNETQFYPFQLPYEECIIDTGNELKLFYPSSFCKVINYNEKEKELSQLEIDAKFVENEMELQEKMNELNVIKSQVQETKNNFIKIITLFISIFTFLFSSIGVFSSKDDGMKFIDKINNTSIFGFILIIFCSLMYIITSNDNKWIIRNRIWIFILIPIISFILIISKLP